MTNYFRTFPPPQPETARAMRERLATDGVTGPAAELLIGASAAARHEWRVYTTLRAADIAVVGAYPEGGDMLPPETWGAREKALVTGLLVADLIGIGGPRHGGHARAGTARMSWAKGLGSGRWQAADGQSWLAAAQDALAVVAPSVAVAPSPWGNVVVNGHPLLGDADSEWVERVFVESTRRVAGLPDGLAPEWCVGGTLAEWDRAWSGTRLYAAAEAADRALARAREDWRACRRLPPADATRGAARSARDAAMYAARDANRRADEWRTEALRRADEAVRAADEATDDVCAAQQAEETRPARRGPRVDPCRPVNRE